MVTHTKSLRLLVAALFAALLAPLHGCQAPRTEVIVAVDADATILALIDSFRIEVTSPSGALETATASLSDGQPLPRTLGLYWTQGSLGPYRVVVSGMRGTSVVTTREARFTFVRDRTLVLRITLVGSCLTTLCTAPQVCGENGCRDVEIALAELEPWTGTIERRDAGGTIADAGADAGRPDAFVVPMDAGMDAFVVMPDAFVEPDAFTPPDAFAPDAFTPPDTATDAYVPPDVFFPDGCAPVAETCNMADDDCDARTDEDFDLTTDLANCGMCGNACMRANATPRCVASSCEIATCDMGFDDCNSMDGDGCEANLRTDNANCGRCGDVCMGGRMCCRGMCRFSCP